MRAAYLGPPGTNSHDALIASGADVEPVAYSSVPGVVRAVQSGEAELGLVPLENSREGGVGSTLDALVFDAPDAVIVGEVVHRVTYVLVAEEQATPDEVRTVHSHPQALGQCATFLAEQLPGAALVAAPSTADAVRAVMEDSPRRARATRGDRHPSRGRALRRRRARRGDRGRRGERDPLRLDRARRRRRARSPPPPGGRRSSSGAAATSRRAGWSTASPSSPRAASTSAGSSRGRAGSASGTTCSSATSTARRTTRTVAAAIAGAARTLRAGSDPRIVPAGRLSGA